MDSEMLAELNPDALLVDGFEDALIGVVQRCGLGPIALYSQTKYIYILMKRDDISFEEAVGFLF